MGANGFVYYAYPCSNLFSALLIDMYTIIDTEDDNHIAVRHGQGAYTVGETIRSTLCTTSLFAT